MKAIGIITYGFKIAAFFSIAVIVAASLAACEMASSDASSGLGGEDWGGEQAPDDTGGNEADSDDPEETEEPGSEDECDIENEVVLYLSADDSNSMAGPVLARAQINQGYGVFSSIRTYEFLNYYSFQYQAPEPGSLNVTAGMRLNADETQYDLQIGVRAWDIDSKNRRPVNLTLSLDTSGSMAGHSIELVRASCLAIAGSLVEGDNISMVTWSTDQNILLDSLIVDGPNDDALVDVCQSLDADGGTDLHSGLVAAYDLAAKNFSPNRINRVILMSDGGANVGITDEELIAEYADDVEGESIYLMGVGVGEGDYYNDLLMDTVTDAGKGAYIFIDDAQEAEKMFGERFLSNIELAARDVQVELTLPPSFEMAEFHGEEYSENPEEVEPQHLAPNDAMIFHQILSSCDPTVVDMSDEIKVTANYLDPLTREEKSNSLCTTLGELLEADAALLLKGNAIVEYALSLKDLKTLSGEDARARIDLALEKVNAARVALANDPDLQEIEDLLTTYRSQF